MAEGEGAQSGAEGAQSGTGSTTDGNGTGSNSGGSGTQSGTGENGNSKETPSREKELEAELAKQRERTQAADRRAAEHEAALKQLRDKDLPEQDKLKRDHEEAIKQVSALQETNRSLAMQVAFLKDNTYQWHNPERALKLVDLSKVEIGDDGSVSGLKDALNALAKSDPYLVDNSKEKDKETAPPGTAPGNNGRSGSGQLDVNKLSKRFPALNTRVKSTS